MSVRNFKLVDTDDIIKILKLNNQFDFPEVDGPDAMKRVYECISTIFLVYESSSNVIGFIRGSYDGSRAMIHQLSIQPEFQKRGIGSELIKEIVKKFNERGADTISATITEQSYDFWKKNGFDKLGVFLVGNFK